MRRLNLGQVSVVINFQRATVLFCFSWSISRLFTSNDEMFIQPKTHWNIKKNYYSNGNQFKRKICKGSLEIFLFLQITLFLADLCCILAVFKYNYLKIAAT